MAIPEPANYRDVQQSAFGALVEKGVYSERFEHAPHAQKFFGDVIAAAISQLAKPTEFSVLDCGCGPGAWLDFISKMELTSVPRDYFGFDLTEEMVAVAGGRLAHCAPPQHFHAGDILADSAYQFPQGPARFDLVFTYDVIQQLPRKIQFQACEQLLSYVADGGVAIIFDNDCHSTFGRKMGFRKFITRNFGIELVPRYFCNANYPPLARFAKRLSAASGFQTHIQVSENGMKRAVILSRS